MPWELGQCERPPKSVQLVNDHPGHLAGPDLAHHGVELWPSHFCSGLPLDEQPGLGVASRLTKHPQLLSLGVGPLVGGGNPDVEGRGLAG